MISHWLLLGLAVMIWLQQMHRTASWSIRLPLRKRIEYLPTKMYFTTPHNVNEGDKIDDLLLTNWIDHPSVNPVLIFPTLLVPSESIQQWIRNPNIQTALAKPSNCEILQHIHPRIKMIQEYNKTHKLLLLIQGSAISPDLLDESVQMGPTKQLSVTPSQLSFSYILSQLLPVPPPTAYEQIGHVAHFNLKPQHMPYAKLIGQVLRETNPTIDTVVTKLGEVSGKYRTYPLEVLAGPPVLETTVVEYGVSIQLNVAECYWCTRLSGEREELLKDILEDHSKTATTELHPLKVADVFCGVGAVCLRLAKLQSQCEIWANDWNPTAIAYLQKSIAANGLDASKLHTSCQDTYDFLMDLGSEVSRIPDHILMNYPLEAPTFLGSLRWWPAKVLAEHVERTSRSPRFHVYTFSKSESRDANDEEDVAVDIVANQLLPLGSGVGASDRDDEAMHRREELNHEFDARVSTRLVRDVAPGKVVVCVSFSLTPKLVRYLQGDFS